MASHGKIIISINLILNDKLRQRQTEMGSESK